MVNGRLPEDSETRKRNFKPTTVERFELGKGIWAVPWEDPNSPGLKRNPTTLELALCSGGRH